MIRDKVLTYRLKTEDRRKGRKVVGKNKTTIQSKIAMFHLHASYSFHIFGPEKNFIHHLHLDTIHLPFGSKLSCHSPAKPFQSLLG